MIVYTNSKTVEKRIQDKLINVVYLDKRKNINLDKTQASYPLLILEDDFIGLEKLLVSYFHRKSAYELAIISDKIIFKTERLLESDVLALISNTPLASDISTVLERYKYRRDLFQSKKNSPLLLALSNDKIILTSDIRFIRAYGNYTLIFTTNERIIERVPFSIIQEKLPSNSFIQTHRSFAINILKVGEIKQRFLKIGNDNIPISARKRSEVINRFKEMQLII